MRRSVVVACVLTGAMVTAASPAAAEPPRQEPVATDGGLVHWPAARWPRVHVAEYVAAPALIGAAFLFRFAVPDPDRDFSAGTAFDRELEQALLVRNATYRRATDPFGLIGFIGSMVYRGLEDLLAVGLWRRSWDVGLQMLTIDALSFGLIGVAVWGTQIGVGRQRPRRHFCANSEGYRETFPDCSTSGLNRSLFSGHIAAAVAGASLTCLHHARFPVYSEAGARAACGTMSVMAGITAVARTTNGWHWPTDILLGAALGVAAGWVVPRLLHYGWDVYGIDEAGRHAARADRAAQAGRAHDRGVRAALVPAFRRRGGGLRLVGAF